MVVVLVVAMNAAAPAKAASGFDGVKAAFITGKL
jgi:hypothetical protein